MTQIVTITSQGQLTIPQEMRKLFGIKGSTKAILRFEDGAMIVQPKTGFWSIPGSIPSKVKLSDAQLRKARLSFEKNWARPM